MDLQLRRATIAVVLLLVVYNGWVVDGSLADPRKFGLDATSTSLRLEESMLPLSIGVEVYGGHVEHCLPRGAWAPTEHSKILLAEQFEFLEKSRVVAGERTTVASSNIVLGEWDVPSIEWRLTRKRPYASYVKPQDPSSSLTSLVILTCSVDEDMVLTVDAAQVNVSLGHQRARGSEGHSLPVLSSANRKTLFRAPIDTSTLQDDAILQHIQMADLHTELEGPRRQAALARLGFEQLVHVLWKSMGGGSVPPADDHHHLHHPGSDEEYTAIVERAVLDGIDILTGSAGAHQPEHFWRQLQTSLRRRIAFEDDDEEGTGVHSDL